MAGIAFGAALPKDVDVEELGELPELMGELHALASGHSQQGFMGSPGLMMNQFIRDRAGPWNPLDAEKGAAPSKGR